MNERDTAEDASGFNKVELPNMDAQHHEGPATPHGLETVRRGGLTPVQILANRLDDLEMKTDLEFLRREARLIPSVMNFWQHFKLRGARSDPRSKAALSSMLWRILSPGAAAAAGGGLLLAVQTFLIVQQNEKLDQQTYLMQAQANMAINTQIGPLFNQITEWMSDSACLPESKFCWIRVRPPMRWTWIRLCAQDPICKNSLHERTQLTSIQQPTDIILPNFLQTQISVLTQSARPYRFLESFENEKPELSRSAHSLERGAILINLISLGARPPEHADFSHSYISDAAFDSSFIVGAKYVTLRRTTIHRSKLSGVFEDWTVRCSSLTDSDLRHAEIIGGDYSGSTFENSILPGIKKFKPSKLHFAKFEGAIVSDDNFLKDLAQQNVPGFDASAWKTEVDGSGVRRIRAIEAKITTATAQPTKDLCFGRL